MSEFVAYEEQFKGMSATPILDHLIPPTAEGEDSIHPAGVIESHQEYIMLDSVRAMLKLMADDMAQVVIRHELGQIDDDALAMMRTTFNEKILLQLKDTHHAHQSLLMADDGEMFDPSQLAEELTDAAYPEAKFKVIEALRTEKEELLASAADINSQIESLTGLPELMPTRVLDLAELPVAHAEPEAEVIFSDPETLHTGLHKKLGAFIMHTRPVKS